MPDVLLAVNEVLTEICFPLFGNCDPTAPPPDGGGGGGGGGGSSPNPYFQPCDETWLEKLCGNDRCWRMPFDNTGAGDSINFQNSLISGHQISNVIVVDHLGNPILKDQVFTNTLSGQNINLINLVVPDNTCFSVSPQQETGPISCLGWEYETIKGCDTKTFKIRGIYKNGEVDCFGFIYPHDNAIRLYGYLVEGKRSDITKTVYGKHVKRRRVETYYTLYINDMLPPIIHHVLARQILAANSIQVEYEGKIFEFITDETFTLASEKTNNRMFHYGDNGIQLKFVCEVAGKC